VRSLLELDADDLALLQTIPTRGTAGIPTDPAIYRFHEMLSVYGPAIDSVDGDHGRRYRWNDVRDDSEGAFHDLDVPVAAPVHSHSCHRLPLRQWSQYDLSRRQETGVFRVETKQPPALP
jgi:hypothetical protein